MTVEILPGLEIAEELLTEAFPAAFMVAEGERWLTYPASVRLEGSRVRFVDPLPCHGNCRYLEIEGKGYGEYLTIYVGEQPRFRHPLCVAMGPRDKLLIHLIPGNLQAPFWRQVGW